MILLISTLIVLLFIAFFSKLKKNKQNSFPKEYLDSLRNKPKSSNY
jgi:hypothetical protein